MKKFLNRAKIWKYRRVQKLGRLGSLEVPALIHHSATFAFHENVHVKAFCRLGKHCHIDGEGGVTIGKGTIFAPHTVVLSSSHNYDQNRFLPYGVDEVLKPVRIGEGCWIGWGAMICPGCDIGDGVVVGMGAVVTGNIPAGKIVAGNPARVVKSRTQTLVELSQQSDDRFLLKNILDGSLKKSSRRGGDHVWVVREWTKANKITVMQKLRGMFHLKL